MIPNIITIIRLIATIPLFFLIMSNGLTNIYPFIIFILIIITDFLDGFIARKYNMITSFGKIFDPIVDKLLIILTTLALLFKGIIPVYSLFIFIRDIIINIGSIILMNNKKIILSSDIYGKTKTVLHFIAIGLVLLLTSWNIFSFILLILAFITLIPECIYVYNLYISDDRYNKIINKKNNKENLSYAELYMFFNSFLNNSIDDNTMTSLLKSICKNGMSDKEIINLTDIFIKSGDTLNLKSLGETIDKHSTGGVGDKTTLILGPIVASCGVKMPKMSGRALGYTGGTIDKLESTGARVNLTEEEFINQVKSIGFAITSQTKNLCPMDKKVYALRDITGTTSSIGLIASSIMSKKIASGSSKILIDLKVGKGALINNISDATELANIMIKIGKKYHREVKCMLTKMDNPLGDNIGNIIEIMEVIDILKNHKENSLSKLVKQMAIEIVSMGNNISINEAFIKVENVLTNGDAYKKFVSFIEYQGGSLNNIILNNGRNILSNKDGYISKINALEIGQLSMNLGAGRKSKNDKIDYKAGIIIHKNLGDKVQDGDILCTLYGDKNIDISNVNNMFTIVKDKCDQEDLLIKTIN